MYKFTIELTFNHDHWVATTYVNRCPGERYVDKDGPNHEFLMPYGGLQSFCGYGKTVQEAIASLMEQPIVPAYVTQK